MANRQSYPDLDSETNYIPSRLEREPVPSRRDHLNPTTRPQPRGIEQSQLPDWLRDERTTAVATTSESHFHRKKSISPCFTAMEMWCMSEPKINSFLSLPDGFADSATYNGSDLDTKVDVTRPGNPRQRSPCFDSREMWILSQMCHPSVNGGSVLQRFQGIHASVRQRTNEQNEARVLRILRGRRNLGDVAFI
ncbi:uncharacterized protein LOC127882048 isoform X2 [Dreissena polymorpha]|uniref:uncharacterized protein LOC127882048 isoform X2 n=1 Tax=Dreissena polymorpha TaxID=45954 RepID=UPI002263D459|nr:uncharacterized protein LOC127882048 isoform X2 [Dreissena polymorpha]